ncbi:rRNA adenine N-6-methyltransferase family protein [Nonomuraea sp. NPDC023979]|uniref:rRNA adenine N-6-methyltransferase family protein n=1 Tax=Nonomuraea sp. NPDC023979 TaxID=3154796 RepID=UPI0033F906E2
MTDLASCTDLTSYLVSSGVLDPSILAQRAWIYAMERVPRHEFVPTVAWAQPQDNSGAEHLIDRDRDPKAWWSAVYSNTAIITQRDDGAADISDVNAYPTSSLSSPHVVAEMLCLLDADKHHRVLEIGTGSGWTAGLLAWRCEQVTSIEIDRDVAAAAAVHLDAAGATPVVMMGDGARGAPDGAPWDRVHVTCGVRDIPYAWVEQTRPGGVIVLPWMPMPGQWGYQLRLDVLDDGSAVGRVHGSCGFMMLRSQRHSWPPPGPDDGIARPGRLDPRTSWDALDKGFGLALAAAAPHLSIMSAGWEGGDGWDGWVMRLRDLAGAGWATVTVDGDGDVQVSQSLDRPLWSTLETIFFEWLRAGRPGPGDYRIIVRRRGQDVWLP